MNNLHKFFYKDYYSLQSVSINNINRCLDYELLIDDTKKQSIENRIIELEHDKRNAHGRRKEQIESEIAEKKAQLSVNTDVLKYRNKFLTGSNYSIVDPHASSKRVLRGDVFIKNIVVPNDDNNRFTLNVQYPGLVTGIGINHEAKIEGEFKLGVHFDWTYGMPIIYGSSVKGVLHSWFIEFYKNSKNNYYKCGIDADDLLRDIFSGEVRDIKEEQEKYNDKWEESVKNIKKRIYKSKSIYKRDIFFDAVIVKPDYKGRILCSDSITPHGDNPLKNPTPITFIKIAPGCTIEFRFKLVPTEITSSNGTIMTFSESNKIGIFKEILTTVGIGAKTNVGYGQLIDSSNTRDGR